MLKDRNEFVICEFGGFGFVGLWVLSLLFDGICILRIFEVVFGY